MKVLICDDDDAVCALLETAVRDLGFEPEVHHAGLTLLSGLERDSEAVVVLLDIVMPNTDGIEVLSTIRERYPRVPIVMISARDDAETIVRCLQLGAVDYLAKPIDTTRLRACIRTAVRNAGMAAELEKSREALSDAAAAGDIIYRSGIMESLIALARKVADTEATVLIQGESGVGKELMARFVHRQSSRVAAPFLAVNCAALPENLVESTLFGHEAGAFTGAKARRAGVFEDAGDGTVFLDEIGDMPLAAQAKLLRVLQERTLSRIGSNKLIKVACRVVCATNKDLLQESKDKSFREDLYYRISSFPLRIPPLRERREDIVPIANAFIRKFVEREGKELSGLSAQALKALETHPWPGNVRELQNAIERAVIMTSGSEVGVTDLPDAVLRAEPTATETSDASANQAALVRDEIEPLAMVERKAIEQAMKFCSGDISEASRRLEVSRNKLYRRLSDFGLNAEDYRKA